MWALSRSLQAQEKQPSWSQLFHTFSAFQQLFLECIGMSKSMPASPTCDCSVLQPGTSCLGLLVHVNNIWTGQQRLL